MTVAEAFCVDGFFAIRGPACSSDTNGTAWPWIAASQHPAVVHLAETARVPVPFAIIDLAPVCHVPKLGRATDRLVKERSADGWIVGGGQCELEDASAGLVSIGEVTAHPTGKVPGNVQPKPQRAVM